jgi:hypothetical protein
MQSIKSLSTESLWDMLSRIEENGKAYKEALERGQEFYRQPLAQQREKWKQIKQELNSRTNSGLAKASVAAPAAAPAPLTPKEFHRMCAQHDWGYEYSDDSGAHRAGKESAARIADAVHKQPELTPILQEWRAHIVAGGKIPKEPE